MMAFAPNVGWLLVGRLIAGLTGASMTVASSYLSDITPPEKRSERFGLIGAAWGLGFIAGPLIGASLDLISPQAPFFVAATLNFTLFFFTLLVLPESLPNDQRRTLHFGDMNPFLSLTKIFKQKNIAIFVWIYFFLFFAGQSLGVNWPLYTQLKFRWTPMQLGFSLSLIGLIIAISQTVLTRWLIPRMGERKSITLGLFFYTLCFFLFSVSDKDWMIYATIILFAFTGVSTPALQSLMTQGTPPDRQGELQGSLVSIGSGTAVLAPLIYTPLFTEFTKPQNPYYFPGVDFLLASLITAIVLVAWNLQRNKDVKDFN
jgi:DHA1 family tetracycline resistance protein-like MFS transporter